MAGLGFKDFQVGEVLTSADVDGYLMQQSVMRFASDAARGSALGTATGTAVPLAEGMVTYLDDQDVMEQYVGTGWVPVPRVVQVQSATTSTTTSNTTTSPAATSLSVSLTPKYADSSVLVMVQSQQLYLRSGLPSGLTYQLYAGGTAVAAVNSLDVNNATERSVGMLMFVDVPGSTSSRTYQPYIVRTGDAVDNCEVSGRQNIVAVEVRP